MVAVRDHGRTVAVVTLCCLVWACASTDPSRKQRNAPEQSVTCDDPIYLMWSAVHAVILRMGAKIEVESVSGGMLVATLSGEGVASEVQLHVQLTRSPSTDIAYLNGVTIYVKAVDPRVREPDQYLNDYLAMLEKVFLDSVMARADCLVPLQAPAPEGRQRLARGVSPGQGSR